MTRSLITNGRIVTAVDDYRADILIDHGRIEAIARRFPAMPGVPVSAASGHSRMDYSLFNNKVVTGKVEKVFSRGRLIVDGDQWLGETGSGQFLKRAASGRIL